MTDTPKARPSWQVDLKWMLALGACVCLLASGVLYSLARVTERETALPLSTALIAAGISDRVTDEEYAQIQAAAVTNPAADVTFSPVLITVGGGDVVGLTKEQAATLVATKLATVLYEEGALAAEALIVKPPEPVEGAEPSVAEPGGEQHSANPITLGPAGALSSEMHSSFAKYFRIAIGLAAVLLAGVVVFSRGAGRLGSPAFVIAIASAPLLALWVAASSAVGPSPNEEKVFVTAAREAFRSASADIRTTFLMLVAGAVSATVLSVLGVGVSWLVRKAIAMRSKAEASDEPFVPEAPVVSPEPTVVAQTQPSP